MAIDLRERVRDVPDWPEQGIIFRDITPLLRDPEALDQTIHELAEWGKERRPDVVLGAPSPTPPARGWSGRVPRGREAAA